MVRQYLALAAVITTLSLAITLHVIPSPDCFALDNPLWNGHSRLTSYVNLSYVSPEDINSVPPHGTALLIVGVDRLSESSLVESVSRYLSSGGMVIVADDWGLGRELVTMLDPDLSFGNAPIADNLLMYGDPHITLVEVEIGNFTTYIYLNYATWVSYEAKLGYYCVGYTSAFSYVDFDGNGIRSDNEPYGPFCAVVVKEYDRGILVVISDSSLFINSMIDIADNIRFLRHILGGRRPYMVVGLWKTSTYTEARRWLVWAVSMLLDTNARYPLAVVIGFATYYLVHRFPVRDVKEKNVERLVKAFLRKCPTCKENVVRTIVGEMIE